ncbi:unnamed protein product [Zymoseptoria tritici ST99CH_3D1]|nr:unnamed protein product [Zymoseptoria tritici ST99CH_3D1]
MLPPMSAAEKARLIKLGQVAINQYFKHWYTFVDSAEDDPTFSMDLAAQMFAPDVKKLLILAEILYNDEGREFFIAAESIAATYKWSSPNVDANPRDLAGYLAGYYYVSRDLTAAKVAEYLEGMVPRVTVADQRMFTSDLSRAAFLQDFTIWLRDDLMDKETPGEDGKRQSCSYCGLRSNKDRVMMKCGRCKVALYCDTMCQKLDWKCKRGPFCDKACKENHSANEHKTMCEKIGNEKKEADGEMV